MLGLQLQLQGALHSSCDPTPLVQGKPPHFPAPNPLLKEFFGQRDLVPLDNLQCVSWSWRISVAFGEHLLTRPTSNPLSRDPPTKAHIQVVHEIRGVFDYALLMVRKTIVRPFHEETLAQLRTALVDLFHLTLCSLAYGE